MARPLTLLSAAVSLAIAAAGVAGVPAATATPGASPAVILPFKIVDGPKFNRLEAVSRDGQWVVYTGLVPHPTEPGREWFQTFVLDRTTGQTEQVSLGNPGRENDGSSQPMGAEHTISDDGNFVAFSSQDANLPGPPFRYPVGTVAYVRDRAARTIEAVDVSSAEVPGNRSALAVALSGDGRFVAFTSSSTNLVPNPTAMTAGDSTITFYESSYLRDRLTGTTVELAPMGGEYQPVPWGATDYKIGPKVWTMTSDARHVIVSDAFHFYDLDPLAGTTTMLPQGFRPNGSFMVGGISDDGRFISLTTTTDLTPDDTNITGSDVYVYDAVAGVFELISTSKSISSARLCGVNTFCHSGVADTSISGDGRFVAFSSESALAVGDVVPPFRDPEIDAYLRDRLLRRTSLLSSAPAGPNTIQAFVPLVPGDGGFALFESWIPGIVRSSIWERPIDTAPPTPVVTPMGAEDGATYEFGTVPTTTCRVDDEIDGTLEVPVSVSEPVGPLSASGLGTVVASCDYSNSAGVHGSAAVSYIVRDTTAPVLSVPASFSIEATGHTTPIVFEATALDSADGDTPVWCSHQSGERIQPGQVGISCIATDQSGNQAMASFSITVTDTRAPEIVVPPAVTAAATSAGGATVAYAEVRAVDIAWEQVTTYCTPASGLVFRLGSTDVVCTATDGSGNEAQARFTVTVQDATAPIVSVPSAIEVEATSAGGAVVAYSAVTAIDDIDGSTPVACDAAAGSLFALGSTTVTCTATDYQGNIGTSSFRIDVVDRTRPILNGAGDVVVEADSSLGSIASLPNVTALDAVSGTLAVTCDATSGAQFGLGDTVVTCSAADAAGNSATTQYTVSVRDTRGPVVERPTVAAAEATSTQGATVNFGAVTAVDTVDGPVAVSCAPGSGSVFALGVTTVSCSALDARGNTGSVAFPVSVVDTTAPQIVVPANITLRATSSTGASVPFTVQAVDIADGPVATTCSRTSGAVFPLGTTTVTCTSTDRAGNGGTASFTVTVLAAGPTIVVPRTVVVEATGSNGAYVRYPTVTASDPNDGTVRVTCSPTSGSRFPLGITTVTCRATNRAGVTSTNSFEVKVVDTTAPSLSRAPNLSVIATSRSGRTVGFVKPVATDAVSGVLPVTCAPASGSLFALGTTTVTCSATDAAGNVGRTSFTVRVTYAFERDDHQGGAHCSRGEHLRYEFHLTGDSSAIRDAVVRLWATQVGSPSGGSSGQPVAVSPSPTSFGYRSSTGRYVFDLDTSLLRPGIWQITLDAGDGNSQVETIMVR
jgi:hypothetical protein